LEVSLKLSEIFNKRLFRVPDYQRGYAWRIEHIEDFWQDLEDLRPNRQHYTGSLFIEESNIIDSQDIFVSEDGFKKFDIVDGQQRMTTIIILLNELIVKLDDNENYDKQSKSNLIEKYIYKESSNKNIRSYIFNYMASDQNYQHMKSKIYADERELEQISYNAYAKNLDTAKLFFFEKLLNLKLLEREKIFIKLTNHLRFDLRNVEKELDVQAVFETMNNRGKKLTILERLKNRLVFISTYLENISNDEIKILRNTINHAWKIIYQEIARNTELILDDDDFFISHLSLYKDPKESVFSYEAAEKKIFEMFSTRPERFKEDQVTYSSVEKYLKSISTSASKWHEIHNSEKNGIIEKILILSSSRDVKIILLAILLMETDTQKQKYIFLKIESALFRNRVPGMWVFDERQLATWARDIYTKEKNVSDFCLYIDVLLNTPIDTNSFLRGVDNLFTYVRGNFGYHRWSYLKYFLYAYDEYLRLEFRETSGKLNYDSYEVNTIEHVIPQNWSNNWPIVFDDYGAIKSNVDVNSKIIINSLGNLTLLVNGKNSSLGDKPWESKQIRYETGSYNEIEISKNPTWGLIEITERGFKLLKFMEKMVIGLKLTDEEILLALFSKTEIISEVKNSQEKKRLFNL
jgi:uncharacterized protein with ParB-like and HNH nuclease domain